MDRDPLLGKTLAGRYRLIARLGSGGMSAVYLARHVLIDRLSAIKILHEDLTLEEVHREHFLREARAVNRINHPNIVEISDYGEATVTVDAERGLKRNVVYLVMEYVPGESLQRVIAQGPLPIARVVPIAMQVGAALARAHQTGVVHRDVKPENILLVQRRDGGDVAKLTDFGVAKVTSSPKSLPAAAIDQVFGTPGYVAPEYLLGETSIDGRADLYSLGVVMYRAITGGFPFESRSGRTSEAELLTLPLVEDPIPASQRVRDLPPRLEALMMRLLARRADDRPHDAFRFLDELAAAAHEAGVPSGLVSNESTGSFAAIRDAARVATVDDEPPMSMHAPSIPPEPRFGTMTPAALVAAWRAHWDAIERRADRLDSVPEALSDALHRAMLLTEGLDRATHVAAETQRALDVLHGQARDFRGTLGNAIDVLARDLSKAHARVVQLTSERAQLHLKRRNTGEARRADAMLWEEAAVDDDLRNARSMREDLGHQIGTLQDELFKRNVAHEEQVQLRLAELEGQSAALASLHRELELVSGEVAPLLRAR